MLRRSVKRLRLPSAAMTSLIGVLMAFGVAGFWLSEPSYLNILDYGCYDFFLRKHHRAEQSDLPVIVNIDEESLRRFGQWPWPRYRIAAMLKNISKGKPHCIGMDILFSEPDRTSPVRILSDLKSEIGRKISFSGLPDGYMDHDQLLADSMALAPTVLGAYCRFDSHDHSSEILDLLKSLAFKGWINSSVSAAVTVKKETDIRILGDVTIGQAVGLTSPFHATGMIPAIDVLSKSAMGSGFINAMPDSDGILRRTPLLVQYDGVLYPSLALEIIQTVYRDHLMLMRPGSTVMAPESVELIFTDKKTQKKDILKETTERGEQSRQTVALSQKTSGALHPLNIPLDPSGRLMIHFRGSEQGYQKYAAAEVLDGKVPPEKFKDKIVLVGVTANVLQDSHITPLKRELYGVEIQAEVIDTILTKSFIQLPVLARSVQLLGILMGCISFLFVLVIGKIGWGLLLVSLTSGVAFGASEYLFAEYHQFISPVPVILAFFSHFVIMSILNFFHMERDKRFLKNAFSKFVAKPIVDQVVSSPGKLKLQGEDKKLSILFSDIRDFTSLSEHLSPEEVTQFLQEYFTPMTRVITKNNGTLDKFIGDGIMAFWNAPLDIAGHERWAFDSAVGMLSQLGNLNIEFKKKYGFEINIGIGLHVGVVRVGNMGTEDLFNYTIIGDEVNIASRLESLSKFYGVRIIISEKMIPYVPVTHWIQDLDLVRVKGRLEPLKIYGLFSGEFLDNPKQHLDEYHKALSLYRQKEFKGAFDIFTKFRDAKYDRPLYKIYQERCAYFMKTPPNEDWDGVFVHRRK